MNTIDNYFVYIVNEIVYLLGVWILALAFYCSIIILGFDWITIVHGLTSDQIEYAPWIIGQSASLEFYLLIYLGGAVMSFVIAHKLLGSILNADRFQVVFGSLIWHA